MGHHYRPIADEYLSDAVDRINTTQKWIISKWPVLLEILETAKTNQGGEFHKRTADRFRETISYRPEYLHAYICAGIPAKLEISVTIPNGKQTCQYYKATFYLDAAKDRPKYRRFTVANVSEAFAEYERAHVRRVHAENVERAAYWSVHHFF